MNPELETALLKNETDLDGVRNRFMGDESLYLQCLNGFLEDSTMEELGRAIDAAAWDDAFTAAHALKGLAGNMGFVPLFHATAELVVFIRTGRTEEIGASYAELKRNYISIARAIKENCTAGGVEV